MTTRTSVIEDLDHALAAGTDVLRIEVRITDLFIAGAGHYTAEHINLFDEIIAKLAAAIEPKDRAELSVRLAEVPNAPKGVVRMLAFDSDIEVAGPVLRDSERLEDADLVANANSKSQLHLAAIAGRKVLSEAVTEALVTRGDHGVVQAVAANAGARFSDLGFRVLVQHSLSDDALAIHVGTRRDLPRHHLLQLLELASSDVRARLAAENLSVISAGEKLLSELVGGTRSEISDGSDPSTSSATEVDKIIQLAKQRASRQRRTQAAATSDDLQWWPGDEPPAI